MSKYQPARMQMTPATNHHCLGAMGSSLVGFSEPLVGNLPQNERNSLFFQEGHPSNIREPAFFKKNSPFVWFKLLIIFHIAR